MMFVIDGRRSLLEGGGRIRWGGNESKRSSGVGLVAGIIVALMVSTFAGCGRSAPRSGAADGHEICDNLRDDDGDGLVDCDDTDCSADPLCGGTSKESCFNGVDDDGDGFVDCDDEDCAADPACPTSLNEICDNGADDDLDGAVDCADRDCALDPGCLNGGETLCGNQYDDDGDGLVDCDDGDCLGHPSCLTGPELCSNGRDDDRDGAIDCDDADCRADPICVSRLENCSNGADDDDDALIDCNDPDCFTHPSCRVPGVEVCNNRVDDDEDGAIDCQDSDCSALPLCQSGAEICDNGHDDDDDGATDCADPDCASDAACVDVRCQPTVDFGVLPTRGAVVSQTLDTRETTDVYPSSCAVPGGGEVVARLILTETADVALIYEQLSGDHVFGLYRAGVDEPCTANSLACFDPHSKTSGSFTLSHLAAGTYYLVAEAFAAGLEGQVRVTLRTGSAATVESCANGIDDDGDLSVDCADLDCALDPVCNLQQCDVDINLGALAINGEVKTVEVDTRGAGDDVKERCAGDGGADRVIRLVMPEPGQLAVSVIQDGWHVLGMHGDAGPGKRCEAREGTCFDTNAAPIFTVGYDSLDKGAYYYTVDALSAGHEGTLTLSFGAYKNRGPELCSNGVDDDDDGLRDCLDPDCIGVSGCQGPVCLPDQQAGTLLPDGDAVSFDLDTRLAIDDQTVACALGGGKDVVVAVDLPEVSGLSINCVDGGDHVLGLFSAGAPRDPCDINPSSCADPSIGPIGCNFVFPNLQPGKYYLVVEAFQPGAEGPISLQLRALSDHVQEICDNGVDDDGDGMVDCRDSNCATQPACEQQRCVGDPDLGLLVKGGASRGASVTTMGAADHALTSCGAPNTSDAVVALRIVETSTLEVDYAQFGDHVFALHGNLGAGYTCDADRIACVASNGRSFGRVSFSNVPPGDYFLVVDAASTISAGSVALQLAAR